jgi:hypothetical protein
VALSATLAQAAPPATAADPAVPAAKPQPPAGSSSLVKRPKGPASWTITFKYNTAEPSFVASEHPTSVTVTKIGDDSLQVIQFPGRALEVWRSGQEAFISEPGVEVAFPHSGSPSKLAAASPSATSVATVNPDGTTNPESPTAASLVPETPAPEDIDWSSLGEFSWVTPELLKGKVAFGNQPTLIYAELPPAAPEPQSKGKAAPPKKWPAGPLGGLPLQPGLKAAAIDEATQTPRALQLGDEIWQYTFATPSQTKLEFPPKVKALLPPPAEEPKGKAR